MTTGDRIKMLRTSKGFSQEELGEKIGVKKAAINKYENGIVVNLKRETIEKLAEVLEVTPVYIMGFEGEEEPTPSNEDGLNSEILAFIEKVKKMDSSTVAALNQLADSIIAKRDH